MAVVIYSFIIYCGKTSNMQLSQNNLSLQAIWLAVNLSMTDPIYSVSRWLIFFCCCIWHTWNCFNFFNEYNGCIYVTLRIHHELQVSFIRLRFRYFDQIFSFRTVNSSKESRVVPPTLWFSPKRINIIFRGCCQPRKLKSAKIILMFFRQNRENLATRKYPIIRYVHRIFFVTFERTKCDFCDRFLNHLGIECVHMVVVACNFIFIYKYIQLSWLFRTKFFIRIYIYFGTLI